MLTESTPERSLAEIVNDAPGTARILESHGLDYCCGGQRTLADACADSDVDMADVIQQFNRLDAEVPAEWTTMGAGELVDHLEATHHAYLHSELDRLEALTDKVVAAHGAHHPELLEVRSTYGELRSDLQPHLLKEEQVLFPMIRQIAAESDTPEFHCGSVGNPISVMTMEHDRAGALLADLRRLTNAFSTPDDGCASYRALYEGLAELEADTHLHVHKENNVLFPAVLELESRSTK
jgi:regulator of cell morphogenesis and NO signaling